MLRFLSKPRVTVNAKHTAVPLLCLIIKLQVSCVFDSFSGMLKRKTTLAPCGFERRL